MVGTIMVHDSGGKVMAPMSGGSFIEGQHLDILVTAASGDEDLPLFVRQALVGLTIPTIFSSEQLCGASPEGSRAAYVSEVAKALEAANKAEVAKELLKVLEGDGCSEYDLVVFESGQYELVA